MLCVGALASEEPPGGPPEDGESYGKVTYHTVTYVCDDGTSYQCTYITCPFIFGFCTPSYCTPDPGCA